MDLDTGTARAGEIMFARYAYPPNELGYCGPDDPDGLMDIAAGRGPHLGTRGRAFTGAWVYLDIIASAAGINDPLDPRVVEAYWVGNGLLEQVDPAAFAIAARTRFGTEIGAHWAALDVPGPHHSVPHHGFHVFTVYPWVALLGRRDTALQVLDRCRIRWGKVISIADYDAQVDCRRLTWDGHKLALGPQRTETVRWAKGERSLLSRPAIVGDWVSLHWDWACDRLAPGQMQQLVKRTDHQLDITNHALRHNRGLTDERQDRSRPD